MRPASVSERNRVEPTRLDRSLAFFASVQRPAAMFSPDRWTTASRPSSLSASIDFVSGSQRTSSPAFGLRRTSRSTSWPPARSDGTSALPMSPLAPVIAIRIGDISFRV